MSFNHTHPEIQDGEIFFCNLGPGKRRAEYDLSQIRWKTKRVGNVAYTDEGNEDKDLVPVFISKAEVIKSGHTLELIRWYHKQHHKSIALNRSLDM